MFRRLSIVLSLVCVIACLGMFNVSSVSAQTTSAKHSSSAMSSLSCPSEVAGSYVEAEGSTPAYVTLTLWKNCAGTFYAQADIVSYNGWVFTGTVSIFDQRGDESSSYCSSAGICDSSFLSSPIASIQYQTNRGDFYYLDGTDYGAFTEFGATASSNGSFYYWY